MNGLTIDYIERKMYFTDLDKKSIESADMDGMMFVNDYILLLYVTYL